MTLEGGECHRGDLLVRTCLLQENSVSLFAFLLNPLAGLAGLAGAAVEWQDGGRQSRGVTLLCLTNTPSLAPL